MRYPSQEKSNFLGDRLRELRLKFQFTQEDVAKSLNVSRSTYSYYELGTTRPDPDTLETLAVLYDVPIDVFFNKKLSFDVILQDSGKRKRTSRSGAFDPQRVGDLRPDERSLILFLRTTSLITPKQLVDYLRSQEEKAGTSQADGSAVQ